MTYSSSEHPPGATPRGIDRMLFHEYDAPATGLPLFRIVLALLLLVLWAYNAEWVTRLPDSFLDPRPGPFLLMQSVPPVQVIHAIEVARVLALGALLVGWRTPTASVLVSLLTMTVYGITYSFGKIDHTILLAVTPMVLAPSGWGGRWSIDAWRGRRPPARGWPLALLAVTFGAAYANAGLAKAMGGWWHWDTQAAQGYVLRLVRMKGDVPLGALMESLDAPVLWELVDVGTLAVEIGVLVCALRLRWFRSGLLALVALHVAIFLTMGIDFGRMAYVYAAFLPWDRAMARVGELARRLTPAARTTLGRVALGLACVPVGVALWSTSTNRPPLGVAVRATVPAAEPWVTRWPLMAAVVVAAVAIWRSVADRRPVEAVRRWWRSADPHPS